MTLPSVGFGASGALPDWRQLPDPPDPDDELLSKTPPDVVSMLGFDPLEIEDGPPDAAAQQLPVTPAQKAVQRFIAWHRKDKVSGAK